LPLTRQAGGYLATRQLTSRGLECLSWRLPRAACFGRAGPCGGSTRGAWAPACGVMRSARRDSDDLCCVVSTRYGTSRGGPLRLRTSGKAVPLTRIVSLYEHAVLLSAADKGQAHVAIEGDRHVRQRSGRVLQSKRTATAITISERFPAQWIGVGGWRHGALVLYWPRLWRSVQVSSPFWSALA
jgi:hypothetical protein